MELTEKISVIVPVYKVEEYLAKCVQAILEQTYENLEVILGDDGSPDGCGAICDSFTDPRVRVIHKENGGLSSARNAGMDIATGEYFGFVDSADWIEPDMFETMLRTAKQEQAELVCGGVYDVDGKTGEKKVGLCPETAECITGEEFAARIFLWQGCDSSAWGKLYHRSVLEGVRYPLGVVSEDVPVTYRVALKAEKVAMCPKPLYNYYHRPGSITRSAVTEKIFHYPEHTRVIYSYICENNPAIAVHARYLRTRAVNYLALMLDQAEPEFRKAHAAQVRENRRELAKHLGFLLKHPLFSFREKAAAVLLVLNLYRPLRPIFHRA